MTDETHTTPAMPSVSPVMIVVVLEHATAIPLDCKINLDHRPSAVLTPPGRLLSQP